MITIQFTNGKSRFIPNATATKRENDYLIVTTTTGTFLFPLRNVFEVEAERKEGDA